MRTETTFEEIAQLYPEFNDSKFFPDPLKPLPTTLGRDWGWQSQEVQEMLASKTPEAIKKISILIHHSENFVRTVLVAQYAWLLLPGGLLLAILGGLLEGWVKGTLLGLPAPVSVVIGPWLGSMLIVLGGLGEVFSVFNNPSNVIYRSNKPDNLFQDTYRERVQEWSMKRYGRKIDHLRWTAMDCVYQKESTFVSGEMPNRVYCYEQDGGWILGDADGVELPRVNVTTS